MEEGGSVCERVCLCLINQCRSSLRAGCHPDCVCVCVCEVVDNTGAVRLLYAYVTSNERY